MPAASKGYKWIHGPLVDIGLIGFGWLPVYFVFLAIRSYFGGSFNCDVINRSDCPMDVLDLIALTVFITRVHRHYGLPFVYADRAVFESHRKLYTWAPILLAGIVFPASMYRLAPPGVLHYGLYGIFTVVSTAAGLWNIYHVLMQKFGFLRIYAAKLGYGDPKLDKRLFFTWVAFVITVASQGYAETYFSFLAGRGFPWAKVFEPATLIAGKVLLVPTGIVAVYTTWQWGKIEYANYTPASLPKLIFAFSVFLIFMTFTQSLLLGYIVFGFSHALEYCVFANLYASRKYRDVKDGPPMRHWARWPIVANLAMAGMLVVLQKGLAWNPWWGLVSAYGFTSSILHFIYDGVMWKMSDPEVRKVVLDL